MRLLSTDKAALSQSAFTISGLPALVFKLGLNVNAGKSTIMLNPEMFFAGDKKMETQNDSVVVTLDSDSSVGTGGGASSETETTASPVSLTADEILILPFDLRNVQLQAAEQASTTLAARLATLQAQVSQVEAELVAAQCKVDELSGTPDKRQDALAKVAALRACGLNDAAIAAALDKTYSRRAKDRTLSPPGKGPGRPRNAIDQGFVDAVLGAIRSGAGAGVAIGAIREALTARGVDAEDTAIRTVVNNGIANGKVLKMGDKRGTVYHWLAGAI